MIGKYLSIYIKPSLIQLVRGCKTLRWHIQTYLSASEIIFKIN